MKLTSGITTGILIMGMAAAAWGQNPDAIQNTRDTMKNVQLKKQLDSNAALAASQAAQPSGSHSAAAQSGSSGPFVARRATATSAPVARKQSAGKLKSKMTVVAVSKPRNNKPQLSVENEAGAEAPAPPAKPVNLASRRDPFVNPVVNQAMVGSGCSTGKRCLAIDQIALKGVVRSEAGMIAVVVNTLDKAYFLHENDPVFNGYVVKITGDSIVFKETVQDKIGRPFTREVTKKITTPAV
jgi:hypothetical protein